MLVNISKEDIDLIFNIIEKYEVDEEEVAAIERLNEFYSEREEQEDKLTLDQIGKLGRLEGVFYKALQTYIKKNIDYGDSFSKTYDEFGMIAPVIRINDKVERIKSLVANNDINVADESLLDTFLDLGNYAFMTYVEIDRVVNAERPYDHLFDMYVDEHEDYTEGDKLGI